MQNIKKLLQEYDVAQKESFYLKMLDFVEKKFRNICVFLSSILFLSFFLISVLNSFKNAFEITFCIFTITIILYFIVVIGGDILNTVFGKKERIKRKIYRQKYVGDIYDIFDKECSITIDILRKYKKDLSKGIHESKGLTGKRILFLMNCISEERYKQKAEKLSMEEKEALITGETKIGNMLKAVENI